jgi:hypothetical protein
MRELKEDRWYVALRNIWSTQQHIIIKEEKRKEEVKLGLQPSL